MVTAAQALYRTIPQNELKGKWWALGALELHDTQRKKVRDNMERSRRMTGPEEIAYVWELTQRAHALAGKHSALDFARNEPDFARTIALRSYRAFTELTGLRDDDDEPFSLAPFHVRALRYMRQYSLSCELLPFAHGKSAIANIVVSLMDWAEQRESKQIRIYASVDHVALWTRKLMDIVEGSDDIKILFPWIRKPERGDPCEEIWSTRGFSIGGKQIVDASFLPLTVGSNRVGLRGDRIIADDWVTEGNATSRMQQDKFYRYLKSSAMTMRQFRGEKWFSPYNTKWGTLSLIGTIFDRRDINSRIYREWLELHHKGDKDRRVLRVPVYPRRHSRERGEVIWPDKRPPEYIKNLEFELGSRAFRQRCMNVAVDDHDVVFAEEKVLKAFRDDLQFGQRLQTLMGQDDPTVEYLIGYDPAQGGVVKKDKKYPAAVVMAFQEEGETHIVEWGRWSMSQPQQVRRLIDWAHKYDCPIVVESNTLQKSYEEWIKEVDPAVQVINHYTGRVKHDKADGVESFQPLFENEVILFHAGNAPPGIVKDFQDEWLDWPQGRYTDLVMASWIARYQHKLRKWRSQFRVETQPLPTYARQRAFTSFVDLRKYR